MVLMLLSSTLMALAVIWAHYRLAAYRPGVRWPTAAILTVIATAFGITMVRLYTPVTATPAWYVFITAFSVAHLPGAVVLQLKHWRHRQQSAAQGEREHEVT